MKKLLVLLMLALTVVSCTKQEVYERTDVLIINLSSKGLTRSAITTDPATVENNINTATIGIFASDGTVKTVRDFVIGTTKSVTILQGCSIRLI